MIQWTLAIDWTKCPVLYQEILERLLSWVISMNTYHYTIIISFFKYDWTEWVGSTNYSHHTPLVRLGEFVCVSLGEIDCPTRSSSGRPSRSDFSLIGDCGWPRVPWDNPSLSGWGRPEQWPVWPLIDDFFSAPCHVNGTSQVFPTERQSSWPNVRSFTYIPTCNRQCANWSINIWEIYIYIQIQYHYLWICQTTYKATCRTLHLTVSVLSCCLFYINQECF